MGRVIFVFKTCLIYLLFTCRGVNIELLQLCLATETEVTYKKVKFKNFHQMSSYRTRVLETVLQ